MGSPRHRAVRPRYGRMTTLGAAVAVVATALLGSAGGGGSRPAQRAHPPAGVPSAAEPTAAAFVEPAPLPEEKAALPEEKALPDQKVLPDEQALPAGSGTGRRIVFDQSAQRVWLVDDDGTVRRTYLGSGSVIDNLHPGTYAVYSRSRSAIGVDDSGVMAYFVRFTKGPGGAAIGFHTIPTKHGVPLQSERQLGTPRSHGCIRQRTTDAIALWEFAPVGTAVVVVA
jgi:lipoprotein-anchoring transpeptidase ErfK/SrfK